MTAERCPKCAEIRELTRSSSSTTEVQPDGSQKLIRTDAYHCSTCQSFVRSEAHEEPAPKD